MKTIYKDKELNIDPEDLHLLKEHNWIYNRNYLECFTSGRTIKLDRLIVNALESEEVDHINHDILNISKSNLRKCTHAQNCYNRNSDPFSSSEYKGVTKRIKKKYISWDARIRIGERIIHLGSFRDELEAAKAYNDAAIKYFGEFALVNLL